MASEALLVIRGGIMDEGLVGVMAGDAGEARVAVAPATAFLEPIRLKAHVLHAFYSGLKDVVRSAVTGPAKIHLRDGP